MFGIAPLLRAMFGTRGRLSAELFATIRWNRWLQFSDKVLQKVEIATPEDAARVLGAVAQGYPATAQPPPAEVPQQPAQTAISSPPEREAA